MRFFIVSNNPLVKEQYGEIYQVDYEEGSYMDVLIRVRDLCHKGYVLLSHPLMGSVKPNETVYRSVLIKERPGDAADKDSVIMIEDAIQTCVKFGKTRRNWHEEELADFRMIDHSLISCAVEAALADPTN